MTTNGFAATWSQLANRRRDRQHQAISVLVRDISILSSLTSDSTVLECPRYQPVLLTTYHK